MIKESKHITKLELQSNVTSGKLQTASPGRVGRFFKFEENQI